jgi:hypothetical protein
VQAELPVTNGRKNSRPSLFKYCSSLSNTFSYTLDTLGLVDVENALNSKLLPERDMLTRYSSMIDAIAAAGFIASNLKKQTFGVGGVGTCREPKSQS